MQIGIIGGGLTGLVAAHALARDHKVILFEKMPYPGGCLSSYHINDYWIERYYHHCFSSDVSLFSLLEEMGLFEALEWRNGTTGSFARDTIYPLSTPLQILRYPELSIQDKARLGWLTLTAKNASLADLDDIPADQYIIENLGLNVYTSFFEPLLKSKFGDRRKEVSAAWLMSRIAIRSNRGVEGERLGYLRNGFHTLIDALVTSVTQKGGEIRLQEPVSSVARNNNRWTLNGIPCDAVISTIAPLELERSGGPALPPIPYQGAACLTLAMKRQVTNGIYWLNMKDPAPYGAVVTHTNFIPFERYGEHLVYLASYFSGTLPPRLDERMLSDFCSRFSVQPEEISWHRMAVDPFAGPVYTTGYRSLIPRYETSGLYLAGMFSQTNYPERSMEGSIRAGFEVAECLKKREQHE
ncbi:MAG: NAD(P)/FAD-dependent oxidoreductase [Methanomicrobiales archaeon]|nr:NAD(P)/FAD-dependent oxidoreductase [Methanomicrobiales archaeon]